MGMANPMAKLDEIDISAIHQMKALGNNWRTIRVPQ